MAQENIKKDELNALQLKCEEYLAGWKRERADFINYKKDESERILSFTKFANEEIIFKLISILDNFNLAARHLQDASASSAQVQGFLQIKKQLEDLLQKEGIEEIEVIEKEFDPNLMETVGEVENSGDPMSAESGVVVEEIQKGYMLNGKLIRPAKVKISK